MIQPSGHFFHIGKLLIHAMCDSRFYATNFWRSESIDFGFIFGRDPKPLPPVFRLTKEMVDGMGGTESKEYRQFCSLACQAFNTLRKSAGLILNLLHLMSDAGIEDLSNNPSSDALGVISKVEERFKLELTDEQAESFFISLIGESMSALAPRVMEVFHQLSVARRWILNIVMFVAKMLSFLRMRWTIIFGKGCLLHADVLVIMLSIVTPKWQQNTGLFVEGCCHENYHYWEWLQWSQNALWKHHVKS